MKIFVSGATGVVGRRAVAQLVNGGHDVIGLSRSDSNDALLGDLGVIPRRGDLFDSSSLSDAIAGSEVVINLATSIPPSSRAFSRKAWEMNDRIRIDGSANLVRAALSSGCHRFIQESITLPYLDCGSDWIGESVDFAPSPATRCVLDAEGHAREFTGRDRAGIVLRFGAFYAPDADHTHTYLEMAEKGIAPLMGPASAYQSAVYADDAASAVLHALDAPPGTYNVVDDEPLTRGEATTAIAESVNRARLRKPPDWLMSLMGRQTARLLMRSQRVSNASFRQSTAWKPETPSMRTGWAEVAREVIARRQNP